MSTLNKSTDYTFADYAVNGLFLNLYFIVKYLPSPIGDFLRRMVVKLFCSAGAHLLVREGVTIWYPHRLSIGDRVSLNEGTYLSAYAGLTIGNDVLIGQRVSIVTSDHNFSDTTATIRSQGIIGSPVRIDDDVWIGAHAVLVAGVTIGKGSVVGAGSVVTKDVLPYQIVGGVPARAIGKRGADASTPSSGNDL